MVGLACYLGLIPFDPATLRFDGIVRRHLEIMTGAGIVAGVVYWMIAGRNAGAWRAAAAPAAATAAAAVAFAAAADGSSAVILEARRTRASQVNAVRIPGMTIRQALFIPTPSAKPRAMNRTGLFIALALALVIGLLFGIYPELDLKLAALFYDPATKSFPLKFNTLAAIRARRRDVDRVGPRAAGDRRAGGQSWCGRTGRC